MALPKQSQMFLQGLMDEGPLSAKRTASLYNSCGQTVAEHLNVRNPKTVSPDGTGLEATVDSINRKLELSGLAIKTVYCPWEQEKYWGIANVVADEAARLATGLTNVQLTYFFAVIEELLESGGEMKLVDLQNFGLEYKLGVSQAGRTIQALNKKGWLKIRQRSGQTTKVVFGIQSMLELPNVRSFVLSGANTVLQGGSHERDGPNEEGEDAEEELVNDDDDDDSMQPEKKRARRSSRRAK